MKDLLPEYHIIKYNIISKNEDLVKIFSSIFEKIATALEEVYNPKVPFRVELNITKELESIKDSRLRAIMYEAVVETIRAFGWETKSSFNEATEELIYIQRHK